MKTKTRIRYKITGNLHVGDRILCNYTLMTPNIVNDIENNLCFWVIVDVKGAIVEYHKAKNLDDAKRSVKEYFISQGVKFYSEYRLNKKRFGDRINQE